MTNNLYNPGIILFDWAGTISNDRQLIYETNQRLLEAYGQPRLTLAEWRDGRKEWNAGNFLAKKLDKPTAVLYEEFAQLLIATKAELGDPQPYPGAVEAFKNLSNGRLCEIISSHPQKHLEHEVLDYGIREFVQHIRGSVSDKVSVIKLAIEEAGVSPERALYVGDTVQDIQAAQQAGVSIAAVTYGYHSEELLWAERPDIIVNSLGELGLLLHRV